MRRTPLVKMQEASRLAAPFSGVCFRNVAQHFATRRDVLSTQGSVLSGGRYNFHGTYPTLYLSCDIHTCVEETTKSFTQAGTAVAQALPRTIIGVEIHLARVLDLTAPPVLRLLGVTRLRLIRTDWVTSQDVNGREAFTQEIGRLAREAGMEAVITPSAALPRTGRNLCIFPDQLLAGSLLRAINVRSLHAV